MPGPRGCSCTTSTRAGETTRDAAWTRRSITRGRWSRSTTPWHWRTARAATSTCGHGGRIRRSTRGSPRDRPRPEPCGRTLRPCGLSHPCGAWRSRQRHGKPGDFVRPFADFSRTGITFFRRVLVLSTSFGRAMTRARAATGLSLAPPFCTNRAVCQGVRGAWQRHWQASGRDPRRAASSRLARAPAECRVRSGCQYPAARVPRWTRRGCRRASSREVDRTALRNPCNTHLPGSPPTSGSTVRGDPG